MQQDLHAKIQTLIHGYVEVSMRSWTIVLNKERRVESGAEQRGI